MNWFQFPSKWRARNRRRVNPRVARRHAKRWPRKPLANAYPQAASKSLTGTVLAPSHFVRSVVTKNRPNSSFASCLSSVSCERWHRSSNRTFISNRPLSALFRRHLRRTWLDCSRTPTCAPSTPSVSQSPPGTSNSLVASAENGLEVCHLDIFEY